MIENKITHRGLYSATIGFFDGVHSGHRFLIEQLKSGARKAGLQSMVVTFARHPRQVLRSDFVPQMLTTTERKLQLLRATGVDRVEVLDFDRAMAGLTAREFMQRVLRDRMGVARLLIGYDNRFGHNRAEGFDDYVRYGRELGIDVVRSEAFELGGIDVSSSMVRSLLQEGEVVMANRCLGYDYCMSGIVVHGFQEGRKLGFPTANLDLAAGGQLIPAMGVYAVRVTIKGESREWGGMMSIGTRPTYNGTHCTFEVNIFDFEDDIYGRTVTVSFVRRMRSEERYDNIKQLVEQLHRDRDEAFSILYDK